MKTFITIFLIFCFNPVWSIAQTTGQGQISQIIFEYDEAGNRIKRHGFNIAQKHQSEQETQYWNETSVYPNPTDGFITIQLPEHIQNSNLQIVNLEGEVLLSRQITTQEAQLDLSFLPSGTYMCLIRNKEHLGQWKVIKL